LIVRAARERNGPQRALAQALGGRSRCRLAEGLALGGAPYGHRWIIPRNEKAHATLITPLLMRLICRLTALLWRASKSL
jgi:hypothetical protein